MKKAGIYIVIFGIASIILPLFDLQLKLLMWVDNWGETVSWAIKIGLIVIGAVLFFIGNNSEEEKKEEVIVNKSENEA